MMGTFLFSYLYFSTVFKNPLIPLKAVRNAESQTCWGQNLLISKVPRWCVCTFQFEKQSCISLNIREITVLLKKKPQTVTTDAPCSLGGTLGMSLRDAYLAQPSQSDSTSPHFSFQQWGMEQWQVPPSPSPPPAIGPQSLSSQSLRWGREI